MSTNRDLPNDTEHNIRDDFYDGVTVLPPWAEAWFAQERARHRTALGETHPDGDDWNHWEEQLSNDSPHHRPLQLR
ncbi:hypothetical protein AXK56_21895 [Tsukamurella pulmonis]|nr:hypothetical protein AXK56_21895 [Tsukamurella pulmonis]